MVFQNIDVDGDGDLSKEGIFFYFFFFLLQLRVDPNFVLLEFTNFGTQFFLCNDESHVSKYFFGPLVE
jgi:hypothetical protein